MAVNFVNPHDVMYYNTDKPEGPTKQAELAMMRTNHNPNTEQFGKQWDIKLPESRNQPLSEIGRPKAHEDYAMARAGLVGLVPNEDGRWRRLNNYYLNCLQAVDRHVLDVVSELEDLGIADNTIIVFTADHGELAGAHGMNGKGANGYREQLNVPFIVSHPAYASNKHCKAVTSHIDIAPTLVSFAGGKPPSAKAVSGSDISPVLTNPEGASFDAIRPGALFNYNMLAYQDSEFMLNVSKFFREGGKPEKLPDQKFELNMAKRGAIRSVFDGRYKLTRYFSPQEHHTPRTLEELFANNDVELFDLQSDPHEMVNLAVDGRRNGELIVAMLGKLNALMDAEVGEDIGQMMPGGADSNWTLDPSISHLRM
jgi:arylsulfatase